MMLQMSTNGAVSSSFSVHVRACRGLRPRVASRGLHPGGCIQGVACRGLRPRVASRGLHPGGCVQGIASKGCIQGVASRGLHPGGCVRGVASRGLRPGGYVQGGCVLSWFVVVVKQSIQAHYNPRAKPFITYPHTP